MRLIKILGIAPAFALVAACGGEQQKPLVFDRSFADDLELAITSPANQQAISALELGVVPTANLVEEAPVAEAPKPAPARSTPSASTTARRSSSGSTASAPVAQAPVGRTVTVKHTKRDAAIGAGAGAVIGAVAGGKNNRVEGAVVGAVLGGVVGGVIGNNVDKSTRVVYDHNPL